jgi:hypothetical protein
MDFERYVPIGNAVAKVQCWRDAGASIAYLSSHRRLEDVARDEAVLRRHRFPPGDVFYRGHGENYGRVAGRADPDVIVEDDCESIGGAVEQTALQLPRNLRERVRFVVVPEFGGIDHLPDDPSELGRR